MSILRKSNGKISSRQQIAIKGVRDGVLILPGNQYRLILQVSSINFELKSEDEQDAIVEMYQSFLNSLACPVQVVIRVREMDVDRYLADYRAKIAQEPDKFYRRQIAHYIDFVKTLIKSNKILARQFFIVIPYAAKEKQDFTTAKERLSLDANIVDKGLTKLGMNTRQLSNLEALDLFYSFYSPHQAKAQPLTEQTMQVLRKSYI